MNHRVPYGQRGSALLIALAAVAIAAVLATELLRQGQRDQARSQALFDAERSWQLAAGLDGLAREWIAIAEASGEAVEDGRWSAWYPVPGGAVRGRVFDRSGLFNLNALADARPAQAERARRAFVRLARELDLAQTTIDAILALYAPGADGLRLRLGHLSELDAVPGVGVTVRRSLESLVTVLPDSDTPLNVNRTRPEVLAAWVGGLSTQQADAVLRRGPFARLEDFRSQPELQQVPASELSGRVAVRSRWFLAHGQVVLHGTARDYYRLVAGGRSGYDARYVSFGVP
ncbi:MAG: hypothetical protein Kow0020_10380 [Wenzhouxiangellaceae bacterium]